MRRPDIKQIENIIKIICGTAVITAIAVLLFQGCITAPLHTEKLPEQLHQLKPSYLGDVKPEELATWEVLDSSFGLSNVLVILKNPNETSLIKRAAVSLTLDLELRSYRYFKDGKPYQFDLDKNGNWVEYKFTEAEAQSCKDCHGPKGQAI